MPSFLIMEYPRAGSDFLTFTYYLKIFNTCGGFVGGFFCGCGFGFVCDFFFKTGCNQVLASIWYMILTYQSVIPGQERGTKLILFATGGALRHCQYEYQCTIHLLGRQRSPSAPVEPVSWAVLRAQPGKPGQSHTN